MTRRAAGVWVLLCIQIALAFTTCDAYSAEFPRSQFAPPLVLIDEQQARKLGLSQFEISAARRWRPEAAVRVRWLADLGRWRVSVRAGEKPTTLALVEIDGLTGEVVRREAISIGKYPPRHTQREAIDAAIADPRSQSAAKKWGTMKSLRASGHKEDCCWEIDFFAPKRIDGGDRDRPVIRADVIDSSLSVTGVWTGHQIAWTMARGDRYAFGGAINHLAVWYGLCVLFALVVIDWTRLWSLTNADVLALLAFAVSWEAFVRGEIGWSVPLAVPPLAWIAARMGWIFIRGFPERVGARPSPSPFKRFVLRPVPTVLLIVLCVALAGLRIGITLEGGNVIDVGYAGVAGAELELSGKAPWGNMPHDVRRGDTYGPLNYLAYVPATAAFKQERADPLGTRFRSAQVTSIVADLASALLIFVIGWRWISRRAGVLAMLGWLACPWTALVLASGANDAIVALMLLAAFISLRSAAVRGAFVAAAALVKVAPILTIMPLLHVGSTRRLRQSLLVTVGCASVIMIGLFWSVFRLDGDSVLASVRLLWDRTVAFQAERESPFSIWGLYEWHSVQSAVRILVVFAVLAVAFFPRARDAWQVAAGCAAVLALAQLTAGHWFYLYIPWFVPFVLIVVMVQRERYAHIP